MGASRGARTSNTAGTLFPSKTFVDKYELYFPMALVVLGRLRGSVPAWS
jgi:hypothetical protein